MPNTQNPFTVKNGVKFGIGFFIAKYLYTSYLALDKAATKAMQKKLKENNWM